MNAASRQPSPCQDLQGEDSSRTVMQRLLELLESPPVSSEPVAMDPPGRSWEIAKVAAWKAAAVSGTLAIPPGPLGLLTILPDLGAIWRIQARMVADIAAAHGKQAGLTREHMAYCLFKHAAAHTAGELAVRTGPRFVVKAMTGPGLKRLLERIGVSVTERVLARGATRWVPVVGMIAMGAYAYHDTIQVAKTAIRLFNDAHDDHD